MLNKLLIMKNILIILAVLTISLGFGQTAIKKSSVSSGGGVATQGTLSMVYTVGELAIQENTVGTVHLSEGFIGPDIIAAMGVEDYTQLDGVNVYPNPVKTNVNIELPDYNNYEIRVFDLTGKELMLVNIEDDNRTRLNLSQLKSGMYLLSIIDREHKLSRIIKLLRE
jgi:hypothetical protein